MQTAFKVVISALMAASTGGAFAVSNTPVQNFGLVTLPFTAGISDTFAAMPAAAPGEFNFFDDFLFSLPVNADGSLTASAVSVDLSSLLGIENLQARVYQVNSVSDLTTGRPSLLLADAWSSSLNSNGFKATVLTFANPVPLPAGQTYAFEVRGNVIGSAGGSYGGNLNVSAVPEVSGWMFGLAGLGLMAIAARRRAGTFDDPSL